MKRTGTGEVNIAALSSKEFWTTEETAAYLNMSLPSLYRMSMNRDIPFYKPGGKRGYFKRTEVLAWLQKGQCRTRQRPRSSRTDTLPSSIPVSS